RLRNGLQLQADRFRQGSGSDAEPRRCRHRQGVVFLMSSQWEAPAEAPAPEAGHLEFHFSDYWNIVVRRRKLIALFIAIGLAGAAAASFLAKPLYKAAAVLSVEKDRGGPVEISTVDQGGASYDPEFLPTQMRLIKSREIAERVARQLNLANTAETLPAKSGLFR